MNETTFGEIYSQHGPAVYAFLRGLHGRDEHAALDSHQETFLKAYAAWSGFDPERPVLPWLFTIASRVRIDAHRRAKVLVQDPEVLQATHDADVSERVALADACGKLLHLAAGRIPERKLEAFLLARTRGLTYQEIADKRGCSKVTVKRDVHDAAAVLSSIGGELGLAPVPVVPLTADQLEAVLRWHEVFREHVNQFGAVASGELTPTDVFEDLSRLDSSWDAIVESLPGGEEELSWSLGATLQACRALLPDSGPLWDELLRKAGARIERISATLEWDPARELRDAERQHAMAVSFLEAAEAGFTADDDDDPLTPEDLAEIAAEREETKELFARQEERLEALRAGSAQEPANRRATVEQRVADARAHRDSLLGLARRTKSARAATPKGNLDRVGAQLRRTTEALEYLLA